MGIKHKVNEKFFETWSSNMAYVLGYIYADGTLIDATYMRGKYITVTSVDSGSMERLRGYMESEHVIFNRKSIYEKGKPHYGLKIGSHKIYNDLLKLGLYPNKSLTISFPTVPQKYLADFVRGYFDGDGCIYLEKGIGTQGQKIVKRLRTIFTSGSRDYLVKMNESLKNIGLENGKIYTSQRAYQLVYPTQDSVSLFIAMYSNAGKNSFFMRKFNKFKEYFKLRPVRSSDTIEKILSAHSYGHVVK